MDNFWESVGDDRDVIKYLPDRGEMDRELDREFAYTILNTLRPGYLREVVEHAVSQRQTTINTKLTPDTITIRDDILDALSKCPAKPVIQLHFSKKAEYRASEGAPSGLSPISR